MLHFITSPSCRKPWHIPNTPQLLCPSHHHALVCKAKEPYPFFACQEHIWPCALLHALSSWLPDTSFSWLSLPFWSLLTSFLWELLPCCPFLLKRCPLGGHPRPAPLLMPHYMPRDLSYSHTSNTSWWLPSLFLQPRCPPWIPIHIRHAYWDPCLCKPQKPKFQYVPNRVHRLSPPSIPLARSLL